MWRGGISFGLVNIPIGVYVATEGSEFSFNQMCNKGHRIRYKKWCPVEEREVPYSEIKKGYEISKDNYVVIDKQDLERIKLKSTSTIDVKEFVDEKELVKPGFFWAPNFTTTWCGGVAIFGPAAWRKEIGATDTRCRHIREA